MGYMTDFRLSVEKGDKKTQTEEIINYILERQKENANIFYLFEQDLRYATQHPNFFGYCTDLDLRCNHAKWYEHDENMVELSLKFPDIVFKLHGEGEETEDIWDCYYKNGKKALYEAEIVIPPFCEEDLK